MSKRKFIIKRFDESIITELENIKDSIIYMWKHAIKTWHPDSLVDKFKKLIKINNIKIVYFENIENPFNKPQWVILDEDNNYWTGSWGSAPWGRIRIFSKNKSYSKKYFSEKVAKNSAEKMKEKGVFGKLGKYHIETV